MRILAIRGANVASLAGEFALELDRGPLASAGLFAIVGPTGAGKSTLLDALCAALYNRTPRLDGRSQVKIGRPDEPEELYLSPFDPRSLLRRGATRGWSEVDFTGRDGRRWRARWEVRRARNKVTGRLRDVEQSLVCLDTGENRTGTRTETLAAIEDALGLSFDQFRRSALLAQGEFAAFLRADAAQRAELLERVTGTEIYGELSIAAHRRAQEAIAELEILRAELGRIAVLDDEARAALQARRDVAAAEVAAATDVVAALEAARAWQIEAEALGSRLGFAERAAAEARTAAADLPAARARLGRLESAEAVRAPWRDRAQAAAVAGTAAAAAVAAGTAAAAAAETAAVATVSEATGAAARQVAREALEAARPLIERARRLDEQCAEAADAATAATAKAARAETDARLARMALHEVSEAERRMREAAESSVARVVTAEAAVAEEKEAHQDAELRWQAAEERAQKQPLAPAEATLGRLRDEQLQLKELERAHADAARTSIAARDHTAAAIELRATAKAQAATAKRGARARELGRGRLEEAESARDRLRITAGLEVHRQELRDGEACPLCGAVEHPLAFASSDAGNLAGICAEQDRRVAELRAEIDVADRAIADARAAADAALREAVRRDADATSAVVELEAARRRWREGMKELGELLLADDPASADEFLAARLAASAAALAGAKKDADAARRRADELRRLADVERAKRHDLEHADEALKSAIEARRIAEHRFAANAITRAEAGARIEATEAAAVAAATEAAVRAAQVAGRRESRAVLLDGRATDEVEAALSAAAVAAEEDAGRLARAAAMARQLQAAADARHAETAEAAARAEVALTAAGVALAAALADASLDEPTAAGLLAHDRAWIAGERARLDRLDRAVADAEAVVAERRARRDEHEHSPAKPATHGDLRELAHALAIARDRRDRADAEVRAAIVALAADDDARLRRADREAELGARAVALEVHRELAELIGSHDGRKLRTFAQSLSLDALLSAANHHLLELQPRYRLERVRGHDLELQVVDREMGDEVRSVHSLSGGESFLVSLALALALSSLSARDVRVRTLLIDEGFGTLDPATLDVALDVLDTLQSAGRQVGIISHVPGLAERVPAQVVVAPLGGGRSSVSVRAAAG